MKTTSSRTSCACFALAFLFSLSSANATTLYLDNMESAAGWGVNAFGGPPAPDVAAMFGYDYSADGIPEAPNSQGGDAATTGVKLEANLVDPPGAAGYTLYPVGQNFTGPYQLRFDVWMNYDADERINGASSGTTEFIGGGIGYDNTTPDIGIGAQLIATGDGGSASDWRAFGDGTFLSNDDMTGGSRNGFIPYYSDFLVGVAPPVGQAQTAFPTGVAGSPGFQWVTFEINTFNGRSEVFIEKPGGDRLQIAVINLLGTAPYTSDGNIGLYYADLFSSVTARPDLTFGLIDNVVVTEIPEPTAALLAVFAAASCLSIRRR